MSKFLLLLLILLAITSPAIAQNTLVSATVTDAGGQAWVSGTYTFTSEAYPSIAIISGTLDAAGAFTSISFPTNNVTAGVGGRWRARICPAVTAPCYGISISVPGGSTLSLTSVLTPPAITIDALKPPPVTAYTDSEIINSVQGSRYFNITDNTEHVCKALPCSSNWTSSPNTGSTGPVTANKLDNVILCDGVTYSGTSALQNAILALPTSGGIVDCSNPLIGNQTFTANPFAAVFTGPIKIITGPYTIQYDATAFAMALPHDSTILGYGTTWLNSTAQSLAAFVLDTSGRSAQQQTGILSNRVYGTTGSITTGTATLTVASASNLRLGQTIAILGAAGSTSAQATTINQGGGIGSGDTSFIVVATNLGSPAAFGNPAYQDNYIKIDNEIMSYSGQTGTTFTGLTRGLFGTTAASHTNGTSVQQVLSLIAIVTGISGTTITLSENATFTVASAPVQAGAMNIVIDGNMVFDMNYVDRTNPPTGGSNYLEGVSFLLGSNELIGPSVRFQNSAHAGVMLTATFKSSISGHYRHIGRPPNNFGFDIWLFASSEGNTVRSSSHDDGDGEILIDDRSDIVTRWAGGSNGNLVSLGSNPAEIVIYTTCPGIEGASSRNFIFMSYCKSTAIGFGAIELVASSQWTTAQVPTGNVIQFAALDSAGVAINASGGSRNQFRGGTIATGSISIASTDSVIWQDNSDGATRFLGLRFSANNFTGPTNTALPAASGLAPTRSGGNASFPDLYGDGTNPVVIAGKSDGSGRVILGTTLTDFSPGAVNTTDLGVAAIPYKSIWLGTAATNNFKFQPAATGQATVVSVLDPKAATSAISWQGGIPCTNGELALSAGWGTTATVTAVVGLGWSCEWTVTSSGTGQGLNPTITDTLVLPVLSASIACEMRMVGGTGTATLIDQTTLSATAPVFTFGGTPVAASTYKVYRRC